MSQPKVALAHDYVTQHGGAERVVLALARAFPEAALYTSLYAPETSFAEFDALDIRTSVINRVPPLRRHHRWALPVLAPAMGRLHADADVVVCSSSGWAHGIGTTGRRVVYCYTPARWLYVDGQEVSRGPAAVVGRSTARLWRGPLRRWDRAAAAQADRYVAISKETARRIGEVYGIEAEVLTPPVTIDRHGPQQPVEGLVPGFHLVVARLMPYKNVDAVAAAFASLPKRRLVVVGEGPAAPEVQHALGANRLLGSVSEAELRWLYTNAAAIVSAAHEDFGLTPLEAAAFGTPSVVWRRGGHCETVIEDETGVFFDSVDPVSIGDAVDRAASRSWDSGLLERHAARFDEADFGSRLREIVREVSVSG